MTKRQLNFMFLIRICQQCNIFLPSDILELDMNNISDKSFEKLLGIYLSNFGIKKEDGELTVDDLNLKTLSEFENLNINKFGANEARLISSIKFYIESIDNLFSIFESKDFISTFEDTSKNMNEFLEKCSIIKNLNLEENNKDIEDDNSDLLDILF